MQTRNIVALQEYQLLLSATAKNITENIKYQYRLCSKDA